MTDSKVNDTVRLPRRTRTLERSEFLTDVLITAVEGGMGYWSLVSQYHWWSPTLDGGTAEHLAGVPNAYVTVHENAEPEKEDNKVVTVGVDDIARALSAIRKGPVEFMSDAWRKHIGVADRANDAAELDSGDCDAIVQVAMFGKVVYG